MLPMRLHAVALHGMGKMTIHDGEFKKGLSLMEQAAAEFPLALVPQSRGVLGTPKATWRAMLTRRKRSHSIRKAVQPRVCRRVHGSFRQW